MKGYICPVRLSVTARQKGDAPQAALIESLLADFIMIDTTCNADTSRQTIV